MGQITNIEFFLKTRKRYREIKAWKSALNTVFRNDWKTVAPILNYSHSLLIRNISLPPPYHLTKNVDPLIGLAGEAGHLALNIGDVVLAEKFFSLLYFRRNFLIKNIISGRPISEKHILYSYLNALLILRINEEILSPPDTSAEDSLTEQLRNFIVSLNPVLQRNVSNGEIRKILTKRIKLFCGKSFSLHNNIELVSFNPMMLKSLSFAHKAAFNIAHLVICGETGTGIELLARLIHQKSTRKDNPYIAVKCSALLKNEINNNFESASGGTLFLDDIWSLPPESQLELLKVLEESNNKEQLTPHIICGSDRDLFDLVRQGKFRKDLYFRINTLFITLPPLRKRQEDIPFLSKLFIAKHSDENEEIQISKKAMDCLLEHQWQGNLIEFENVIQRALIIRNDKNIIKSQDIEFLEGESQSPLHSFSENGEKIFTQNTASAKITNIRQKITH